MRALLLCGVLALLCGCQRDNHPRLPGGPEPVFPSIGPSAISTVGGHAQALPGRSAGDSGSLFLNVTGGRTMTDDGRARPMPVDNFFSDLLDEGTVTWDLLQAKLPPVISAGVATFMLPGEGIYLPEEALLDLSGAPFSGVNPTGDVALVEFIADQAIRFDGDIVTRRDDRNAVGIRLTTSHGDGVALDGAINTSAHAGFNAGHVELAAPNGTVIARGRIRTQGGIATAALDGGRGGNVTLSAGAGDLILRGGAWRTHGHPGRVNGGNGGLIMLTARVAGAIDFGWSPVTYGGDGIDGDGGAGGDVILDLEATVDWFTRIETRGGKTTTGSGGNAGEILLIAPFQSGRLDVRGDGGSSAQENGGDGALVQVSGVLFTDLFAEVQARGSGGGERGGSGGGMQVNVVAGLDDSELHVRANGAGGTLQGGNGGSAFVTATGPAVMRRVSLFGDVRGGPSLGAGGVGGGAGVTAPASAAQLTQAAVEIFAQGGDGAAAGSGGTVEVFFASGTARGALHANVSGGNSSAIGGGGLLELATGGGELDLELAISAHGGNGVTGGPGGTVNVDGAYGELSGSALLGGTVSARGGRGDSTGGAGGNVTLRAGNAGLQLEELNADANGGEAPAGGAGGFLHMESSRILWAGGGSFSANGGAGSPAGDGGSVSFLSDRAAVTLQTRVNATGDNGGSVGIFTAGGGLGIAGDVNIAAETTLNLRGAGGIGGALVVDAWAPTGGNVTIAGSVIATGGVMGGNVTLLNDAGTTMLAGHINVTGDDGGSIFAGVPTALVVDSTVRLIANGAGTGVAGFITLDPQGAGPGNPALAVVTGARLETKDGDGTDQSATNVVLD